LTEINYTESLLNQKFELLNACFANMPLENKPKREWLAKKRREKIFALIVLNNPGLRENAIKNYMQICKDKTFAVGRETQIFDNLLNNLEAFRNDKKGSYYDFITFGRQVNQNALPDLFQMLNPDNSKQDVEASELKEIKKIVETSKSQKLSAICSTSFELSKQLYQCQGLKKYGCLFPDFSIPNHDAVNLFNFPLALLIAYEETKQEIAKSNPGKRISEISFNSISFPKLVKAAIQIVELTFSQLKQFYKKQIAFNALDIESKIRVNFMLDRGFSFPSNVVNKGFDLKKGLFKVLCEKGAISVQQSNVEINMLALELLETERLVNRIIVDGQITYFVNVADFERSKWEKYNRMPKISKTQGIEFNQTSSQRVAEDANEQNMTKAASRVSVF
jgi:hypothetical protein